MIKLNIDVSIDDLRGLLEPAYWLKAERAALKATQAQTANQVSRKAREVYNVTAAAIARRLKMGLSGDGREAYLRWIGTRIGLIEFGAQFRKVASARGKRWGATARIRKDRGRFLTGGGFIAEGNNGNVHVFRRVDQADPKSKLRRMAGPAIPQMISSPEVFEDAEKFVAKKYPEVLANRLAYFLDQQVKRS